LLIRQILLNLLSNAIKFTEKGEVCLRAEQIRETPKSVVLRIEVSDTGIGIPPEAQARIFERFTQADDSITRRYGGSGLGTTIAKQLVELMGGEIGLQSEPGKGANFWFTLELEKQHTPVPQTTGTNALSSSRILIVSSDVIHSQETPGILGRKRSNRRQGRSGVLPPHIGRKRWHPLPDRRHR